MKLSTGTQHMLYAMRWYTWMISIVGFLHFCKCKKLSQNVKFYSTRSYRPRSCSARMHFHLRQSFRGCGHIYNWIVPRSSTPRRSQYQWGTPCGDMFSSMHTVFALPRMHRWNCFSLFAAGLDESDISRYAGWLANGNKQGSYLAVGNRSSKQTPKNTPPEKQESMESRRDANFSEDDLVVRRFSMHL